MIDGVIKRVKFMVFSEGHPGRLNEFSSQAPVTALGDGSSVDVVTGGIFAGDKAQKTGQVSAITDQAPIADARHQVCADDASDPWNAEE